jgi:hypothetical protein
MEFGASIGTVMRVTTTLGFLLSATHMGAGPFTWGVGGGNLDAGSA